MLFFCLFCSKGGKGDDFVDIVKQTENKFIQLFTSFPDNSKHDCFSTLSS